MRRFSQYRAMESNASAAQPLDTETWKKNIKNDRNIRLIKNANVVAEEVITGLLNSVKS